LVPNNWLPFFGKVLLYFEIYNKALGGGNSKSLLYFFLMLLLMAKRGDYRR